MKNRNWRNLIVTLLLTVTALTIPVSAQPIVQKTDGEEQTAAESEDIQDSTEDLSSDEYRPPMPDTALDAEVYGYGNMPVVLLGDPGGANEVLAVERQSESGSENQIQFEELPYSRFKDYPYLCVFGLSDFTKEYFGLDIDAPSQYDYVHPMSCYVLKWRYSKEDGQDVFTWESVSYFENLYETDIEDLTDPSNIQGRNFPEVLCIFTRNRAVRRDQSFPIHVTGTVNKSFVSALDEDVRKEFSASVKVKLQKFADDSFSDPVAEYVSPLSLSSTVTFPSGIDITGNTPGTFYYELSQTVESPDDTDLLPAKPVRFMIDCQYSEKLGDLLYVPRFLENEREDVYGKFKEPYLGKMSILSWEQEDLGRQEEELLFDSSNTEQEGSPVTGTGGFSLDIAFDTTYDDDSKEVIIETVDPSGEPLPGCLMEIGPDHGSAVAQWVTGSNGVTSFHLQPGNFLLTELKAPEEYRRAESIRFEVKENGELLVKGETAKKIVVSHRKAPRTKKGGLEGMVG